MSLHKSTNFVNLSVQLEDSALRLLLQQAREKPGYTGNIYVLPLPALTDNYIWVLFNHSHCVAIDPGDAQVVLDFIQKFELTLSTVLITHHHFDHTDGLPELIAHNPDVCIFGPNSQKIPLVNQVVDATSCVFINELGAQFQVMESPGHTLDHIMYLGNGVLFSGDTLFSIGCGRLFEGTFEHMYHSLYQITRLPPNTQIYCAHEYTLANIEFALTIEPNNPDLKNYKTWASRQQSIGIPTIPTTLVQQMTMNPFLRLKFPPVMQFAQERAGKKGINNVEVFKQLRMAKDEF